MRRRKASKKKSLRSLTTNSGWRSIELAKNLRSTREKSTDLNMKVKKTTKTSSSLTNKFKKKMKKVRDLLKRFSSLSNWLKIMLG